MSPTAISGPSQSVTVPPNEPESEEQSEGALVKALKGPIRQFIDSEIRLAIDPEKIWQYADIRKNELYWRGNQFLMEVYGDGGSVVDYRPINGQWHQENPDAGGDSYDTVINDFRGYGRKFIAVLAQQPPNVKMVPNNPEDEDHIRRAAKANRIAIELHGIWNVKKQNRKLFLTFFKDGTAFGHTEFIANKDKYGSVEEPVTELVEGPLGPATMNCIQCGTKTPVPDVAAAPVACPECGNVFNPTDLQEPEMGQVLQITGHKEYANGCVEHRVKSGLTVTTPFDIEELTDAPWLFTEEEKHKGPIFIKFPWLRKDLINEGGAAYGEGGASTTSGQMTRDIASSPSGQYIAPRKNRLLYSEFWLRPSMYELAQGSVTIDGESIELRDALKKNYPPGLIVTMINGSRVVALEKGSMDESFAMQPPEPAENAFPDPLCKDYIPAQDLTNDLYNIQKETWERAIPQTLTNVDLIDTAQEVKYKQLPAGQIPVRPRVGGSLTDAIANLPVATPEPLMNQFSVQTREHGAEIIGITPPIFGGGAKEQTAYATNLKRNQAMLQLSVPGDAGHEYWERVTFNAVMQMAKYSKGRIPSAHAPSTEYQMVEDIEELLKGGWHAEASDAMPMSWTERRAEFNDLIEKAAGNPQLLDMYGFTLPENIPIFQDEIIGVPEWKVPNQDARNRVMENIRELLKGEPIQKLSAMTGQSITLPSVEVNEYDNHAFVARVMADWFQTEKAAEWRRKSPAGFANCVAYWKAQAGLAMPPPGAEEPPDEGEAPAPKPASPNPNEPPLPSLHSLPTQ